MALAVYPQYVFLLTYCWYLVVLLQQYAPKDANNIMMIIVLTLLGAKNDVNG